MGRLDNKTALVTGAASGIGLACVQRFAAEGAQVVGVDLATPPTDVAGVRFAQLDVCDEQATADCVAAIVAEHGRLDCVVTAAGIAGGGPAHMVAMDDWQHVMNVNLNGTFLSAKHALAQMVQQDPVDGERGNVITIASVEGLEGTAGGSAYNASKGAVVIFTKNMAIDYGRAGIRVNTICPGFIETPLLNDVFGVEGMEHVQAAIKEEHKLRRLGRPEEIASAALFLASPDASFVSGHALVVDGAYTAGRDHHLTEMFGIG
jgi:NAD(P)-dependent dehydrogenase (short-subunit alcohol dehydrogenase family)